MESFQLRLLLTIAAAISVFIDCFNATIESNNGHIYFEIDIFTVVFAVCVWFI